MRRPSSAGVLTVALLAMSVGARAACAQAARAAPEAATEPFRKVTADLPARTFDRVLPFDVPFFIVGTPLDGTVRLEVQHRESSTRDIPDESPWLPASPAVWQPDEPATATEQFVVLIREPLEAERYFEFRFRFIRQPSAAQTAEFRSKARDLFDDRLSLVGIEAGTVPPADAAQIRADLAAIVQSVAGSAQWQPVPGSTFDTSDASLSGILKFLDQAVPVLGFQVARAEVLREYVNLRLRLRGTLGNIQGNADLKTALAAAQELDDAGLNELLKLNSDGLSLLTLTPPQMDLAAAGGVMGDLVGSWRPEGPAARAANYARLAQQLQQLEDFARAVSDGGGAARPLLEPVIGAAVVARIAALPAPGGPIAEALGDAHRLANDMTQLAAALRERDAALVTLTEAIVLQLIDERFVDATSVADGATTQKNYISADGGILYAGDIGQAAVYVGSNIYLRPVNKDAPLSQKGSFSRRFAFVVGVTVSSIADENDRTRQDLFANSSLVLGAGIRVTQSIRLGGGALVFKETDPNPLVTKTSAATTWFMSFSFDIDVARGLQGLGGEFK